MISGKSPPLSELLFAHVSTELSRAPVPLGVLSKIPKLVCYEALGTVPGTRPPECFLEGKSSSLSLVHFLLLAQEPHPKKMAPGSSHDYQSQGRSLSPCSWRQNKRSSWTLDWKGHLVGTGLPTRLTSSVAEFGFPRRSLRA